MTPMPDKNRFAHTLGALSRRQGGQTDTQVSAGNYVILPYRFLVCHRLPP